MIRTGDGGQQDGAVTIRPRDGEAFPRQIGEPFSVRRPARRRCATQAGGLLSIQLQDPGLRVRASGLIVIHHRVCDARAIGRKLRFGGRMQFIEVRAGPIGLRRTGREQRCHGEQAGEFHLVIIIQLRATWPEISWDRVEQ